MSFTALTHSSHAIKSHIAEYNVAAEILRNFLRPGSGRQNKQASQCKRFYAGQATAAIEHGSSSGNHVRSQNVSKGPLGRRAKERQANKEFFVDLLSSAATKRDAKAYISRLKSLPTSYDRDQEANLPKFSSQSRAVEDSPVFTQYNNEQEKKFREQETVHIALVKISNLSLMTDEVVSGIAMTLSQLSRLSMAPCVVLEEDDKEGNFGSWRKNVNEQAGRLVSAIDENSDSSCRVLRDVLSLPSEGHPEVHLRTLLLRPLQQGQLPIVIPVAYSESNQSTVQVSADEAMIALTREFAGLTQRTQFNVNPKSVEEGNTLHKQLSLDRVIVVDETGAIPSTKSIDERHVFVNLEQEYSALQEELRSSTDGSVSPKHATNLRMLKHALRLLPASASGLITTPSDAANSSRSIEDHDVSGVGTRRQKNPLIHNLLTDKPAYSSSLPTGRLIRNGTSPEMYPVSTFVKQGMPVTILPNPDAQQWKANSKPRLELTDPRIDLKKLVYLIDDSFNRKLDVDAYLQRVNDRLAGVIIAGDYEGGAILTWETPSGADDKDTSRSVPYLDKFAVLKRSQGAGGVADILFNAMVRSCFPDGVCWRSRKDNPVNKWYFERSRGTWKIPDTNWTMFWTTPEVHTREGRQQFLDYEAVCRGVQPTWADNIKAQD